MHNYIQSLLNDSPGPNDQVKVWVGMQDLGQVHRSHEHVLGGFYFVPKRGGWTAAVRLQGLLFFLVEIEKFSVD